MTVYHSGIYQIKNMVSGKRYIGSSVNVRNRLWRHKRNLKLHKHENSILQRAWDKYGESAFVFQILLYCDIEMTLVYEQICLNGMLPEYNIAKDASASNLGLKFSDEHKRKLSESNKGKHQEWIGRQHTEETRRKMSTTATGRIRGPMSEEWKNKLSLSLLGKPRSKETKQRMRRVLSDVGLKHEAKHELC